MVIAYTAAVYVTSLLAYTRYSTRRTVNYLSETAANHAMPIHNHNHVLSGFISQPSIYIDVTATADVSGCSV